MGRPTATEQRRLTAAASHLPALLPLMLWLSPAFPVGAFAYSHGLEWAMEAGDIVDARSLQGWLVDLLDLRRAARGRHPVCGRVSRRYGDDWPALIEINALAVALDGSAERRLETTAQGAAFIAAARAAWDCEPCRRLSRAGRPHRLSGRRRRGGERATVCRSSASLEAFILAQVAQPRLRRSASRADRADRRPEDSGGAPAARPVLSARGSNGAPRRSWLLRVPLRHRRHAA